MSQEFSLALVRFAALRPEVQAAQRFAQVLDGDAAHAPQRARYSSLQARWFRVTRVLR